MKRVERIYFIALFPFLPDKTRVKRRIIRPPMVGICNFGVIRQNHMKRCGKDLVCEWYAVHL